MTDYMLQHKWLFLIGGELAFSVCIFFFLLMRYWFNLQKLSFLFILLLFISDLWIATIGILDYMHTNSFQLFQLVTILFLVYAVTIGKKDVKKADEFIQQKVARWKRKCFEKEDKLP